MSTEPRQLTANIDSNSSQGRFIFLIYEGPTNGGAPGEVTSHQVEDYSVDNLDELLVMLVEEELAYQIPQLAQMQ